VAFKYYVVAIITNTFAQANEKIPTLSAISSHSVGPFALYFVIAVITRAVIKKDVGKSRATIL